MVPGSIPIAIGRWAHKKPYFTGNMAFFMAACYILYSVKLDKFYVGFTQDSVEERVVKHNASYYGYHYTSKAGDWQIFLVIECDTISQAMKIEKHINPNFAVDCKTTKKA